MEHESPDQESATEEGLHSEAEELQEEHAKEVADAPDPREPEEWRGMPKEGGGG